MNSFHMFITVKQWAYVAAGNQRGAKRKRVYDEHRPMSDIQNSIKSGTYHQVLSAVAVITLKPLLLFAPVLPASFISSSSMAMLHKLMARLLNASPSSLIMQPVSFCRKALNASPSCSQNCQSPPKSLTQNSPDPFKHEMCSRICLLTVLSAVLSEEVAVQQI